MTDMDYKSFLKEFGERSGYDFCNYSANSISRRLQKICVETGLSFDQILDRIVTDKEFVKRVVEDITVNTTELFRDPVVWIALVKQLYAKLPKATRSTIWHIGCSTGLEVYSDLIMLTELGLIDNVRVLASDINPTVLEQARLGRYNYSFNKVYVDSFNSVMAGCGFSATFDKYFEINEQADFIQVKPELLGKATFYRQDLVKDKAPFPFKVDAVFLRNVMIYFNDALQTSILKGVISQMHAGAFLLMGKQEDVPSSLASEFVQSGVLYQRKTL